MHCSAAVWCFSLLAAAALGACAAAVMAWGERSSLVLPLGFGEHRPVFKGLNTWGERSSLVLPLGFHGPLFMHCSAAVWCFSLETLLAAAPLGASAAAGIVAPCWNFWSLAVACFNNFQGPVFKGLNKWGERSSLVLPLGFHGPLCMHCSAAVWCFSLLAAAALGASAAAGLVAPCWKF